MAFSPDGKRLASAGADQTIHLWDTASGQVLHTLKGHSQPVWNVAFSPDGKKLASASHDRTVKLWDDTSGRELRTLPGGKAQWVPVDPDDPSRGNVLRTPTGHTDGVWSVAFSPDGKRLASCGADHTVKLWNASAGQELGTLKGHTQPVWAVAFSPDGNRLASASHDQSVKLWDIASGQEVRTLKGPNSPVSTVAFSPDGHRLAVGMGDGTVILYDAGLQTPELFVEREALRLVEFLFAKPLAKEAVIEDIRISATITEPVRQKALELAEHFADENSP